jgi:hypothetical protein
MNMNNKKNIEHNLTKYVITYEDDECTSIWKYDKNKNPYGPVEVEYKWKKTFNPWDKGKKKTLGDLAKENKKIKRG